MGNNFIKIYFILIHKFNDIPPRSLSGKNLTNNSGAFQEEKMCGNKKEILKTNTHKEKNITTNTKLLYEKSLAL